ncbi:DNA helicase RecQ [Hugenholtzia roseola]|uniref:DNA helicase RecQ n=1 Tax=Hugenholtzia roseola TaxID=1002 RepID=UPI0004197834|nr:DNA helicase RecQ [Hugenholtzia roseola]
MNPDIDLKHSLKQFFGYHQFRGNQEDIIRNVLMGRNTFVIMPTGAGKSLCYQLPAVVSEGTAIVISPLIALMKNQVDQLHSSSIRAEFLNSTLSKTEVNRIKRDLVDNKIKLLYLAPESLTKDETLDFLSKITVSFVAIDEAHCISEWGHDFRPEYRRIRHIIERLGSLPVIALTATATPKVQLDIQKNLHMEEASIFKSSFNRKNLYYEVQPKGKEVNRDLIRFVKKFKGKSGIIYCLSRKKVEEIAELLNVNDIKALPYHAGLDAHTRMSNQDAFLNEQVEVIVATIAFGMGIDKPDVRFVVHYDVPKSLEGYYQETGRAGRDSLEGHCLMFYCKNDIQKLEKFNKDKPANERDNARHLLQEMAAYAESSVCRRLQLLHYFGESYDVMECNEMCDNCSKNDNMATFEGQEFVLTVLEAVLQTQEKFTIDHVIKVIRGIEEPHVVSYEHHELEIFGEGQHENEEFWQSVFRQVMLSGLLDKDIDHLNVLKLSKTGKAFLKKPTSFKLHKDHEYTGEEAEPLIPESPEKAKTPFDDVLFDLLKKLRKKVSHQHGVPPYVIFQEPSMEEMCTVYPTSFEEMAQINGVGMAKAKKYGKEFISLIAKYVEENEIETASDVLVKSTANKSKTKIFIIQQIDRMIDLEEIAEAKDLSMDELIEEIEHICHSGTKLNLNYYIDKIMDKERQQELYDYFLEAETDNIKDVLEEFGTDDFSEEEIRLVRIKFLSEYAM